MEDFLCIIASYLEVPIIKTRTAALRGSWFSTIFITSRHDFILQTRWSRRMTPHQRFESLRRVRGKKGLCSHAETWEEGRRGAEQSELRSLKSSVAVEKWKVKADIVQHMATIIKLGGKSAKQAMLNWALRLSSQGAKKEWPCTKMKVYSCEIVLRVCVAFFGASGLCIRAEERWLRAWVTFFMPRNMVKLRVCLFVCCLLRVCVHPSEKFMPGNWDIIGCVFVLDVRAHASKGTGYI